MNVWVLGFANFETCTMALSTLVRHMDNMMSEVTLVSSQIILSTQHFMDKTDSPFRGEIVIKCHFSSIQDHQASMHRTLQRLAPTTRRLSRPCRCGSGPSPYSAQPKGSTEFSCTVKKDTNGYNSTYPFVTTAGRRMNIFSRPKDRWTNLPPGQGVRLLGPSGLRPHLPSWRWWQPFWGDNSSGSESMTFQDEWWFRVVFKSKCQSLDLQHHM